MVRHARDAEFGTRSKVVRISAALPGAPSFEVFAPTSSYPDLSCVQALGILYARAFIPMSSGCRCGVF